MVDNALRCIEEDYPALLNLAKAMGVITLDGANIIPAEGVAWDYIGYKIKEDGEILKNAQGKKYVHINVRTPFSVGQAAAEAATVSPEIAAVLGDPSRFFVTNHDGTAKDPEVPMRVFL